MSSEAAMEEQPGSSRQGYCGYCSLIYTNLDQHVSSARHRDRVRLLSRSSSVSGLMERFLEDVLQHHPHSYADTRPSNLDLPSPGSSQAARRELAGSSVSNDDGWSLGVRGDQRSPERSRRRAVRPEEPSGVNAPATYGQSQCLFYGGAVFDRSSPSIPTRFVRQSPGDAPALHSQGATPSSVHRKCHRKTDRRRKPSSSSSSSLLGQPLLCSTPLPDPAPSPCPGPSSLPGPAPLPPAPGPGRGSPGPLKSEASESFHFSLPASQGTGHSLDWDTPVQVAEREPRPPFHPGLSEAWRLSHLRKSQVTLDDLAYPRLLDSTLGTLPTHSVRGQPTGSAPGNAAAGSWRGYRCLPVEQVRPCPALLPESFRGKTLAQIERDDDEKVEGLVRQFRGRGFRCYFDSPSLARYGRRSPAQRTHDQNQEAAPQLLPLLDHHDDEDAAVPRRMRRRTGLRLASRCQVVKVSHGTQTAPLVVPTVSQPAQPRPPLSQEEPSANKDPAESPEEEEEGGRLPPCYSRLLTPLQPNTSLLLLLCSPGHAPAGVATPPSPASRRCRRRSRPLEAEGSKVRYKGVPLRWYDPVTRRVLGSRPQRLLPCRNTVARQLFRSLSPDLNAPERRVGAGGRATKRRRRGRSKRQEEEEVARPRVKGQRSSPDETPSLGCVPLGTLTADPPQRRTSRGRGGGPGGRSQTPARGRGRRPESRGASSLARPRRRGGRLAGELRKVPGSEGRLEGPARTLRTRKKTPNR